MRFKDSPAWHSARSWARSRAVGLVIRAINAVICGSGNCAKVDGGKSSQQVRRALSLLACVQSAAHQVQSASAVLSAAATVASPTL